MGERVIFFLAVRDLDWPIENDEIVQTKKS